MHNSIILVALDKSDKHSSNSQQTPLFGIPLSDAVNSGVIDPNYPIPGIISKCISYLENEGGIHEVGLVCHNPLPYLPSIYSCCSIDCLVAQHLSKN